MVSRNSVSHAVILLAMLGGEGVSIALADADVDGASNPTVMLKTAPDQGKSEFRIHGLDPKSLAKLQADSPSPENWKDLIPISVDGKGDSQSLPPLLGTYRIEGEDVVFSPRYAIDRSIMRYRILIDSSLVQGAGRRPLGTRKVEIMLEPRPDRSSKPGGRAAVVDAIFPSASILPENTLKFYVAFSSPMSRGGSYEHLQLRDKQGRRIADPFLELDEELWSVDGKRFTLLIDPGRIKRGLKPREEVGPVLQAGQEYTLVIDGGWLDAAGNPLERGYRKSFRVGPADELSPDPRRWTIRPPIAGTSAPLVVVFQEPLDRALAERLIAVKGPGGSLVKGASSLESEESVWNLTPTQPWRSGDYRLLVGSDLEDLAGNSVGRRFEVDLVEPITPSIRSSNVMVPFRIKAETR